MIKHTLRKWFAGYRIAPFGAVPVVAGWWLWDLAAGGVSDVAYSAGAALGASVLAVVGAYVAGLALLPVFALFERLGWRGTKVYVGTAALAALLIWAGLTRRGEYGLSYAWIYLATGASCGGVFARAVARWGNTAPVQLRLSTR